MIEVHKFWIEWFGTLIQLTYTSLAVQINKSKSIYYDHSAKTKNHRTCRAKLHILRQIYAFCKACRYKYKRKKNANLFEGSLGSDHYHTTNMLLPPRQCPLLCMSMECPSTALAITEHSMCHPGLPWPHPLHQVDSPGLDFFHRAKSLSDLF